MKMRQPNANSNSVAVSTVTAMRRAVVLAGICFCSTQTVVLAQTERELDSHEHGAASINVVVDGATVFIELESPWNNLVGFEHSPSTEDQHAAVDSALELLSDPAAIFALNDQAACQVSSSTIENSMEADSDHEEHAHDDDHKDEHDDHADGDDHKEEHDEHAHDDEHKDEHDDHADGDDHDDHADGDDHKEEHDDHADGDEHKEEHDDHAHDDDHKDGHDDHADHDDHGDEETHAEVLAMYSYECENPGKLESVNVALFDLFTGFDEITYQAAGPSGQVGAELSSSNTTLDLSEVR